MNGLLSYSYMKLFSLFIIIIIISAYSYSSIDPIITNQPTTTKMNNTCVCTIMNAQFVQLWILHGACIIMNIVFYFEYFMVGYVYDHEHSVSLWI